MTKRTDTAPRLFLTILEGTRPSEAVPILAVEDKLVIQALARHIAERLGLEPGEDVS